MKINKITPTSNYNTNKNVNINNKSIRTQSCSVDNNYAKVQSPMFCGIFTNLERLKQQHKIVNKAYTVYGESVRALNDASFQKDVALGSAEIGKNCNYTPMKGSSVSKNFTATYYNTHTDENDNVILDSIIERNLETKKSKMTKFNDDGSVAQITLNCKFNEDNEIIEADEIYTFFNGKLDSYVIGYSVNDLDETIEIDAEYNYENGEISSYSKKVVIDSETSEINAEETFSYEYSQLTEYAQNVHFYPLNNNIESSKHYTFLNDKLVSIRNNYSAYNNPND